MTTLTTIQTRAAQMLSDSGNLRFSSALLEQAVRIALSTFDQRLPLIVSSELTTTADGRDQTFSVPEGCLYLVSLRYVRGNVHKLEPGGGFTYLMDDDQMSLHFSGRRIPRKGDRLRIHYAVSYALEGLDEAKSTSLPERCENALVTGTAGHACLLRATGLIEGYGQRSTDVTQLMEASKSYLEEFSSALGSLKVLQEFGYPQGFPLDDEDRLGRRVF